MARKLAFRTGVPNESRAAYPRHGELDRRRFLRRMAGAAGGALASSWLLQACGRATPGDNQPPDGQVWGGVPDTMAAPVDSGMPEVFGRAADTMPAPVDVRPADSNGVADAMAAPLDGAADLDPADGTYDNGEDASP